MEKAMAKIWSHLLYITALKLQSTNINTPNLCLCILEDGIIILFYFILFSYAPLADKIEKYPFEMWFPLQVDTFIPQPTFVHLWSIGGLEYLSTLSNVCIAEAVLFWIALRQSV